MVGFEKHKTLLLSGLVIGAFGLSACSSVFDEGTSYDVEEETVVVADNASVAEPVGEMPDLPPEPLLMPMSASEAPLSEQAMDAPAGGGAWVEREPYNALPEIYGNAAEDLAASVPQDDKDLIRGDKDIECEDDYRAMKATKVVDEAAGEAKDELAKASAATVAIDETNETIQKGADATVLRGAVIGEIDDTQPVQDWLAPEGASLRALLMDWGDRGGWKVIWKSDREYVLEAGAVFRGRYMDVTSALVRTFARAQPAPIATFYKGNRVLLITTLEDENAD